MVRAKYFSKHSGSRYRRPYRRKKRRPSTASNYGSRYGSSKILSCASSRPSSPSPKGHSRCSSLDSLNYRDHSSYDRLKHPAKYNSDMTRSHNRPPHYDRMVWEAVARLKGRKGSSSREIAKALKHRYPDVRKHGSKTIERVIATAKKLVREGKLVKDGSRYRLSKTSAGRKSRDSDSDSDDSRHRSRSTSLSRGSSRSPSRPGKAKKVLRGRKGRTYRTSARRSIKRGTKRRKKGAQKGRTRLAAGKRRPRQKKVGRARRRVKHSSNARRAKSDKLPDGETSQNRGWFGGWFGGRGGGGEPKPQAKQNDKSSSSKPQKRGKQQRATTGGAPELTGLD